MGIDKEAIKKRFSQLEMDINNMNKMIDDNLQINEKEAEVEENEQMKQEKEVEKGHDDNVMSPKKFSEMTAEAAQDFVETAAIETKQEETPKEPVEEAAEKPLEEPLEELVEKSPEDPAEKPEDKPVAVAKTKVFHKETVGVPAEEMAPSPEPTRLEANGEIAIDQTTDTSEDFTAGNVTTAISSNSSFSSPVEPETPIFLPKKNSESSTTICPSKTTLRRPTNPFRVVSVGTPHSDTKGARIPSNEAKMSESDSITKLQKRLDYLTKKCLKLQKEIKYLNDMNYNNTLSIEDGRKLSGAIDKLQEYLDRKTKEKYDLGVLVSRQLRKEIDRGENGQFWIGTK